MEAVSPVTARAAAAFETYLDQLLEGNSATPVEFLAAQDPELRPSLQESLADLDFLRREFADVAAVRPGQIIGDYVLIRPIGRGGMGVVWEAEQRSLGRPVALKLLSSGWLLHARARDRFLREAQAGARVRHEGVVTVHAVGEVDGLLYLAQELIPGGRTLARFLDELRRQPAVPSGHDRSMAELFADVADALSAAHAAGVLHRDVKPANVLLDAAGRPRVCDFGLAHLDDAPGLSSSGEFLGTPFYMSPEQVRGTGVDARSDIFSLGATLFESLTLDRPFRGESGREVMGSILRDDPPDPRRLRRSVPRDLAAIALTALRKRPERRFPSMDEMARDLRRFLRHETVTARTPGPVARTRSWIRRRPVVSTVLAAGLLSLLLVSSLLVVVDSSRRQADEERTLAYSALDFLENVFLRASPFESGERPSSAAEVVAVGLEEIEDAFPDAPLMRARLLSTLGHVRSELGDAEEGARLLDDALVIQEKLLGRDHADTTQTAYRLALNMKRRSRYDEAEALLRRVSAVLGASEGPSAVRTLRVRRSLASILLEQGRLSAAQEELDPLIAAAATSPGEQSELMGTLQLLAGNLRSVQGRFAEAELAYERAIVIWSKLKGANSLLAIMTRVNVAMLLMDQHQAERALAMLEDAQALAGSSLAPDHPDFLRIRSVRALVLGDLGRTAEAVPIQREILATRTRVHGADHISTVGAAQNLALNLLDLGEIDEARGLLEDALSTVERTQNAEHPYRRVFRRNLAAVEQDAGHPGEAVRILEGLLEDMESWPWVPAVERVDTRIGLGHLLEDAGRLEESLAAFDAATEESERLLGASHPNTLRALRLAGYCALDLELPELGVAHFEEWARRAHAALGPDDSETLAAEHGLAIAEWSSGVVVEAESRLRNTRARIRSVLGPEDDLYVEASISLANLLRDQGRPDEAREILEQTYADHPQSDKISAELEEGAR